MNKTPNGRWGRYRTRDGERQKLCNGPLHPSEGAWLHLRSFWTHKRGPRNGYPFSRCIECEKTARGRDPRESGMVEISRVWWIFTEIERRIGRAEACRRLSVSANFWWRVDHDVYRRMRRGTARRGLLLLVELRASGEVRSRRSIQRGAAKRGGQERPPQDDNDYYGSKKEDRLVRRTDRIERNRDREFGLTS